MAAVLAHGITTQLQLEFGYWAVISAVIVMQIYVADSVEFCLYRLSGTTLGALLGIGVLQVVPKSELWVSVALFVTIGICSFLTRFRTQYRMAAITVVIVVLTGIHVEDSIAFGLYRILEIFVGIFCAFLVSILVFPQRRVDVLRQKLIAQAKECREVCLVLVGAFNARQRNVDEDLVDPLIKEAWSNHTQLAKVRQHEALIYQSKFDQSFKEKVILMGRSVDHLHNMARTLNTIDDQGFDIIMSRELVGLAQNACDVLVAFMEGRKHTGAKTLEAALADLDDKLIHLRRNGRIKRFDSKRLVQIFSFYSSLHYFAQDILAGVKDSSSMDQPLP